MRIDQAAAGNQMKHGWPIEQCVISEHDKAILQELAKKLQSLAMKKEEEDKVKLWTAHNDLEDTRPVLLIDPENGWNEIISFEKDIECEGIMAGDWEMYLKKEINWAEKMKDDKPVESIFYMPYFATDSAWGIHQEMIGDPSKGEAYTWSHPITEEMMDEDIDFNTIIKMPVIAVDKEASNKAFEIAEDLFQGILTVKFRHPWWWSPDLSLSYSNLRGLEGFMTDMYDYPEKIHEMMRIFTDGYLSKFDFLQNNNLLGSNVGNCYVGSGGLGHTKELVIKDSNVTTMDMWGFNEAQETSEVSPDMFAEFVLPYQLEIAARFGLNCYGCCEGLDRRWEHVSQIPRLRRVSVSQWSNMETMSELLKDKYVFSYKASPTDLAVPKMDEEYIRKNLQKVLATTKANNNRVEIIMKDNHTLGRRPENAYRWVEIAREEIAKVY